MFTCPADNRVSVDVLFELECLLAGLCSLVDVWLELECLLARLTTVFP